MNTDKVYSDYWLNEVFDVNENFSKESVINIDLIRLAVSRRLISNFVNIITNKNVPVNFFDKNTQEERGFTDGTKVWLSSEITERKDFDVAVGVALHEGSHILLTDFSIAKTVWEHVPRKLYEIGEMKLIPKEKICSLSELMFNYVEDRYIDFFIYKTCPGYRGYYVSFYDALYNDKIIDEGLISSEARTPTFESYEFRIINLTNNNTDLDALPGLRKIWDTIDLNNIQRLTDTKDRVDIAYKVSEIILDNIDYYKQATQDQNTVEDEKKKKTTKSENESSNGQIPNLSTDKSKKLEKSINQQKDFLSGKIKKKKVDLKDKGFLDLIEKNNISCVTVGEKNGVPAVECIVVKNLSKALIEDETFPLSIHGVFRLIKNITDTEIYTSVKRGLMLGTLLGNKLQIRNEENYTKFLHRTSGKLEKRTLFKLGWESDEVFYSDNIDKYKNLNIHISVDASSSMRGIKWEKTITAIVAICKAASMTNNIDVSISFRTTVRTTEKKLSSQVPYIVFGYDSKKDKLSKILNLFPFLSPSGFTPEGLGFEAIINNIKTPEPDGLYYFINLSDGEPFMTYTSGKEIVLYKDDIAVEHTRKEVFNIKSKGYNMISYFLKGYDNDDEQDDSILHKQFKRMYGDTASFINIQNVVEIAKTLNDLFLKKHYKN